MLNNTATRILDPSGRDVLMPESLCIQGSDDPPAHLLNDDCQKVIETPACIIELASDHLFYFRSVGWNFTVLIEAICRDGSWNAVRCLKNPATSYIVSLLRQGKFIPGSVLG